MQFDYARSITCSFQLHRAYDGLDKSIGNIVEMLRKDFDPAEKSPAEFAEMINLAVQNARDIIRNKEQHTAHNDLACEHATVRELAKEDFPKIVASLKKIETNLNKYDPRKTIKARQCLNAALAALLQIRTRLHKQTDRIKIHVGDIAGSYTKLKPIEQITKTKYIVSLDLARYGQLSSYKKLTELFDLNTEINESIFKAITKSGAEISTTLYIPTGDGAIIFLDKVLHAVLTAKYALEEIAKSNREIQNADGQKYYRAGICKGDVRFSPYHDNGLPTQSAHIAGTAIATAARIQAQADTGTILVELFVVDELPKRFKATFGSTTKLLRKDHEKDLPEVDLRPLVIPSAAPAGKV